MECDWGFHAALINAYGRESYGKVLDLMGAKNFVLTLNSDDYHFKNVTSPPSFDDLSDRVHGTPEFLRSPKGAANRLQMVCNETGKLAGMPINYPATVFAADNGFRFSGAIVGPVVIIKGKKAVVR